MTKPLLILASVGAALLTCVFTAQMSPAFAEVCDKIVGEDWTRDQGPAGLSIRAKLLLLIALFFLAAWAKRPWLSALLCFVAALSLLLGLLFDDENNDIWRAAIHEGCARHTELLDDVIQCVAIAGFALLAFLQIRKGPVALNKAHTNG
jgi:hypothetical protein